MNSPPGALVCFRLEGFHVVAGLCQAPDKRRFLSRRPKSDAGIGPERLCEVIESAPVVEAGVGGLDVRGRGMIDIEQDGIVTGLCGFTDDAEHILGDDFNAMIVEEISIHAVKKLTVP